MASVTTQESISKVSSIPVDDQLKGLSLLLSADKMKLTLAEILKIPANKISKFSVNYIRYKPSTNCLAAYSFRIDKNANGNIELPNHLSEEEIIFYGKCYTESDYSNATSKVNAKRWIDRVNIASVTTLDEKNVILYFFPNDALLEGLRILSDPRKIQRLLYEKLDAFPQEIWRISDRRLKITPVRYKPERRAVLRCETRATHRENKTKKSIIVYAKIYSDTRGEDIYALMKQVYGKTLRIKGLATPRPLGYLSERKLILMESLPGKPLSEFVSQYNFKNRDFNESDFKESLLRAVKALTLLHKIKIPRLRHKDRAEYLNEIKSSSRTLSQLLPDLRNEIDRIKQTLERTLPIAESESFGFTHGDFHPKQILVSDTVVGILDFDRSCNGEQYTDIAEFIAHLRSSEKNDAQPLNNGRESYILEMYSESSGKSLDRKRLNYWMAQRLFLLAVAPFRRMDKDWKENSKRILEECQVILTSL
ncbi:MAG: phosphotransferase [candidate division Zixibacteria bacterium]|nr:phosphotransferase [candidate division Zixibacteria bacterium]